MAMKQFGKKTPKAKPETDNDIAISASKRFLKALINDEFFTGKERQLTPALKFKLNKEFQQFVTKNNRVKKAVWPLFIEHITDFMEAAFHSKVNNPSFEWMDATLLLDGHQWAGQA